jgi:hypothetical protein
MDYIVLFDVATRRRPWFMIAMVLLFVVACFLSSRRALHDISERGQWANKVLSWMGMAIAAFGLIAGCYTYERNRQGMIASLARGDVSVIEGVISSADKPKMKGPECFTVQSRTFCYYRGVVGPAFNGGGGAIRQGRWIRVTYQRGSILRLETTNSAVDRDRANR